MRFLLTITIALGLSACVSNEPRYETPYPTATTVAPAQPEIVQTPALVIRNREPYKAPEPKRSAPLETSYEIAPPKGCIELRARQGAC